MDQASKKFRAFLPRFSLRTLLILLTLAGIFVAWQARWMKERRAYLAAHPNANHSVSGQKRISAPIFMGIWGEEGQAELMLDIPSINQKRESFRTSPPPEAANLRRLFPESIVTMKRRYTVLYTWNPGKKWNWETK